MKKKWIALAINMLGAFITWNRRLYVLNTPVRPLETYKLQSLLLSLFAGVMWWISVIAVDGRVTMQISSGVVATALGWLGLVNLVNKGAIHGIQRKQYFALMYYMTTDLLWQIQTRLILA